MLILSDSPNTINMKKTVLLLLYLLLTTDLLSSDIKSLQSKIDSLIKVVELQFVPDRKQEIYDISTNTSNDSLWVSGTISNLEAYNNLKNNLENLNISDQIRLLPAKFLGDTLYGVINVSVADIRTQNRFSSGMATQALLGDPVKIFDFDEWYRIQMHDTYFGWAHTKQIAPMTLKEYNKWLNAPKIIYTQPYGFVYESADLSSPTISDIIAGNTLILDSIENNFFKVQFPDKREGYVLCENAQEYTSWIKEIEVSGNQFINMAKKMMGIPYVWGGTSSKGYDCSGLISHVLRMHGLNILRDASQQAMQGENIDISTGYNNLKTGDLVFFGKENNIRHVGFYIGDLKFIHASGYVKISSFDPKDSAYDELNTKEFIKATRILDSDNRPLIPQIADNSFYNTQK